MATEVGQSKSEKQPVSLLLVEGDTDEVFYKRIKKLCLGGCRSIVKNLEGLYNINAKVVDSIGTYVRQHKDESIRVYCCFDRESRYGEVPEFNIKRVKKYLKDEDLNRTLSINVITATLHIESWFFYDIEGIYEFLRASKSQRKPNVFKPPEKFGYKDLQKLFERYEKTYTKGKRAGNFINHLNIEKIVSNCKELHEGIELIQSQANNLTNHLFPAKVT